MLPTIRCIGRSQLIRVGLVTPAAINGVPTYPACAMSRAELGRVLTNARKVPGTSRTPEPRNSRVITLLNNHGGGHGGVVMTLLDNAMANAALSRIAYTREVVTIDIHVAFMRPATGRLTATGRATGGGKSVCFCEAQIADGDGQVVARAMATFRYREPGGVR